MLLSFRAQHIDNIALATLLQGKEALASVIFAALESSLEELGVTRELLVDEVK